MAISMNKCVVLKWLSYSFLCNVADALDIILSALTLNSKPRASLLPSDVDGLTDEQIIELLKNAPKLHPECAVFQLTPYTVAKISQDLDEDICDATEANALELVFSKTNIPVPRVRRVVELEQDCFLIVMDYIRGRTLAEIWSTFSVWKKMHVAFVLRRYIRQLQRLKASPSTPPGPISSHGPRMCELPGIVGRVQSSRGPFASYEELSAFFNDRCKMAMDDRRLRENHPWRKEAFDDSLPLVLIHQDLNPRNIIEDDDGRLWLIDWAWSGYYPPWFEYVAMLEQASQERVSRFSDRFWDIMIPFVCGPYFRQDDWLAKMSRAFYYR